MELTKQDRDNEKIENLEFKFEKDDVSTFNLDDEYYYELKYYNNEHDLIKTILKRIDNVVISGTTIKMIGVTIKSCKGCNYVIIKKVIVKRHGEDIAYVNLNLSHYIKYTLE